MQSNAFQSNADEVTVAVGFVGSMLIGKTLESVRAKAEAEALKELKNKRVPDKVELSSQKGSILYHVPSSRY